MAGRALTRMAAVLLFAATLVTTSTQRADAEFVYDLSSRLIAITTAFAGTQVLLYGAVPKDSGEIAMIVRGPPRDITVRRKSRVGPLWINTRSVEFRTVPSFYAVASSVPLNDLAGPAARSRHELGTEELRLTPRGSERSSPEEIDSFRTALIRNQQRVGLFTTVAGNVSFLGDTLFRTRIVFPANSPPGDYQVQVLQFADGEVVGAQTSKLEIAKMGIEAELFDFSLARPALYGLSGILIALAAGWAANLAFRRA